MSVVLALALTAALAACGSDEPSGVTGPDRTASTPVSGDAPTATDAPAAATAPTLGPTSAETDREALVALYNAMDGGNWNESANWLSDAPLGEWEGVTTDGDGRVIRLYLSGYRLIGEIPAELGSWRYSPTPDTGGAGSLYLTEVPPQRVERGDTGGAGQPLTRLGNNELLRPAVGQLLQPDGAVPRQATS